MPADRQCAAKLSSRLALGLLLLLLNALLLNGVLWLASPAPYRENVLQHSLGVLQGTAGDDSWGAMDVALDRVTEAPGVPLYTQVFFTEQFRFQYPPSSMLALAAMQVVAPERVQTNDLYEGPWPAINTIIAWAFIAATAASAWLLLEASLRHTWPDVDWRPLLALRAPAVIGLTLTFYPIVKGFTLGQIQVWINGLFALALLAWATGWKGASGVLIGAVALIKPHYGLILLWALLRRELRFAAACAATAGIGLMLSIALYGWVNHLDYLGVLSFLSQHGEAYFPNQSVNGVLNRLMSIADPQAYVSLDLPAGKFPPFTPWIYALTLITSAALLIAALARKRSASDVDGTLDLSTMALTCTMASPIAWEHHYGVTLPIYAVLLAGSLDDRRRLAWLALSYVLVSTYFPLANALAASPLNILQSTLLAGAIVMLVLLHGQAAPLRRAVASPDEADRQGIAGGRKLPEFST